MGRLGLMSWQDYQKMWTKYGEEQAKLGMGETSLILT